MKRETAIVIGAGPAGLTAAFELQTRAGIRPIVLEASEAMGGISQTVNYKGNRIDIGGHRFFSKSDRVMNWWRDLMPLEQSADAEFAIQYQGKSRTVESLGPGQDPEQTDHVMLVRNRKSRIFFLRRFFDYPLRLNLQTVANLGFVRMIRIGTSYLYSRLFPIRNETNLEQFFINRFGRELYLTFFKSYTEKVWGVPCQAISSSWGAQRIKGLSISKALVHAAKQLFRRDTSLGQKNTETSLIEKFLYPKYGPGQMWETCADKVREMGGEILTNMRVHRLLVEGNQVVGVVARDTATGEDVTLMGDYVFSTMPVKELIRALDCDVPEHVREVSEGLVYRDFITVGLLLKDMQIREDSAQGSRLLSDNWIYIQEADVHVGRLQIFNNWSPYMVADRDQAWVGLEYFCSSDESCSEDGCAADGSVNGLWHLSDETLRQLAVKEMQTLGFIDAEDVLDATVIRMPKTYPAYFGTYDRFSEIREFLDPIDNLYLVGRNGMHRYNNQDHSMLTAMISVDNILAGRLDKSNIWGVNTEQEYHEESSQSDPPETGGEPVTTEGQDNQQGTRRELVVS